MCSCTTIWRDTTAARSLRSAVHRLADGLSRQLGGRSRSLIGYLVGVMSSLVVIGAAISESLPLVLLGSLLLGPANASVFLARYAGPATPAWSDSWPWRPFL